MPPDHPHRSAVTRPLAAALVLAGLALDAPAARAGDGRLIGVNAGVVLVRFRPEASAAALVRLGLRDPNASNLARAESAPPFGLLSIQHESSLVPGLFCLRTVEGQEAFALAALSVDPDVLYAEPDRGGELLGQTTPWGINTVKAPQTWAAGAQGGTVRVAVLDTGRPNHPDLPTPVAAANFLSGQTLDDDNGHSTHCSGIVLARDNADGVVGVAPQAQLIIGKVCGTGPVPCPTSSTIAAIDFAVTNGAQVLSMSFFVDDTPTQALADTVAAASAAGVLPVVAAGNSADTTLFYPASYPQSMAVSAVTSDKTLATFSTFGPQVSVAAPGVAVLSSFPLGNIGAVGTASWGGQDRGAAGFPGTGVGSVAAQIVDCGLGGSAADFPPGVVGKIAHIRRGTFTFASKCQNAAAAGAAGVIISNNQPGLFSSTAFIGVSIPAVAVSQIDGNDLQANPGIRATVAAQSVDGYAYLQGTSMACPHVAGAAALVIDGMRPLAMKATDIRQALEATAEDLGSPGRDDQFGHGLINAKAALDYLRATICPLDYNRDHFLNLDDLADAITDFYTSPAIPGGYQPMAPTYPGEIMGYSTPCPAAPDAPAPYAATAYRLFGYRIGYSSDGTNNCPQFVGQPFPNLDNLSDIITGYYALIGTPGC